MYLHEDKDTFREIILMTAAEKGSRPALVEKDYYVTQILRLLAQKLENCVFKGGTSLSKGYHAIERFSEDIDITFSEHVGEARRKKLKNQTLLGISEELGMPIVNWSDLQSDRDYNAYLFSYDSVVGVEDDRMLQHIKLETALGSYAFPTQELMIGNDIGEYLIKRSRSDMAGQYKMLPFPMKVQALERTYIDKIFALCDYYLQGKSKRYSRHLYDVYKLSARISFDEKLVELKKEVREHRKHLVNCPSAQDGVDVAFIINEFCDNDFYREDFQSITSYFVSDNVVYEDVINHMRQISRGILFSD